MVFVPGGTNNFNYANVEKIVDIAKREGVQVIETANEISSQNVT